MAKALKVLIPLPTYGFDPTEAAIPWQILSQKNIEIAFATPNGAQAKADEIMLTGQNLRVWAWLLKARKDAVDAYHAMQQARAFTHPIKYEEIKEAGFDGLLLPGGHDKGVKEYLESKILQRVVVDFFVDRKPVGAICHGVVLAARSLAPTTNRSVLFSYKTTSLLKSQEMGAYNLTRLWLQDYYLTYPEMTVEDEVKKVLGEKDNFVQGPPPLFRDDMKHLKRGFALRDRNYVSARWPGDAYNFALKFYEMLVENDFFITAYTLFFWAGQG